VELHTTTSTHCAPRPSTETSVARATPLVMSSQPLPTPLSGTPSQGKHGLTNYLFLASTLFAWRLTLFLTVTYIFEFLSWCDGQIEVQRAVNLPNFGTIGFQPLMNNKRIAYVKMNDNFMHMYGLHYNPQMGEYEQQAQIQLGPMIKPNFSMMAKSTNMEKSAFH
jgi:hypothetical protein